MGTIIYVFISASLVILFCMHRGHQEQLIEYHAKSLYVIADEISPTDISTAATAAATAAGCRTNIDVQVD